MNIETKTSRWKKELEVTVSTADEFIRAVLIAKPGATIFTKPGRYDFGSAPPVFIPKDVRFVCIDHDGTILYSEQLAEKP